MPDFPRRKTQPTRPFSAALKEARSKAGLTQVQVAAFAGVSERNYIRWESGTNQPNEITQRAVLNYLSRKSREKAPA